jgi:biopolymer transport protein ExbB
MKRLLFLASMLVGLVPVAHAADASWWNQDFAYRKAITLDTTAKGGNVTTAAGRVPMLIRLHSGNFTFDGVSESGADIRFVAADDTTPLNYQVESFDPVLGVALVWVDVPQLGAEAQQQVWMYYGNPKAQGADKGAATFDADYAAVYHFEDAAGTPPRDATAYANNAAGSVATVDGIIGKAARFDGSHGMKLPGSVSTAVAQGGAFTLSAWLKPDAIQQGKVTLYARHQGTQALIVGLQNGAPFVQVGEGDAAPASTPGEPLKAATWAHLAVTAADGKVQLYVDGKPYASLDAALPAMNTEASLGSDAADATNAGAAFAGLMDEVRLSRIARPAALIAVDAQAQGAESKLVAYGTDEKQAGVGFGYFGIIVKSVTLDAWVVIGILMIMAVISWVVMWQRATYVNLVSRANEDFLEAFRKQGRNILALSRDPTAVRLADASLYRLYKVGAGEVWNRRDADGHDHIAPESIEAIRATMDSTMVRENQRLAKSMVMLTIAISGGPFLGLLGTVVGVMITFAAIAAAGDVNVNAIAPGIAAALLATIAGLFVAIPALFGYNYLLIRNKNVTANMQVFVDEFVTRLAEQQRTVAPAAVAA